MRAFSLLLLLQAWNFNTSPIGGVPQGWESRGGSASSTYQIAAEPDGNRYIAATSNGSGVQLGTKVNAKPQEFPILSWRWRVRELPNAADERSLKSMDSAASVYAVFGSRLFPRIIKYVWSTSVPVGTSIRHPNSSRMVIIVVNSGPHSLGAWQRVSRNLVEDYKQAFRSEPDTLTALGVKTDSDSTGSSARADYDDIQLAAR